MYRITRNTALNRVTVTYDGPCNYSVYVFWKELTEAVQFAKCAGEHFDVLVDHTATSIMSPERTAKSEDMAPWCIKNGLRKSANIVPSAVVRMQLQRMTGNNEQFSFFETLREAEEWLAI
ncbi:MAG: hypothetical protein ABJP34_02420 [Erythrobacter sp.]